MAESPRRQYSEGTQPGAVEMLLSPVRKKINWRNSKPTATLSAFCKTPGENHRQTPVEEKKRTVYSVMLRQHC
jgi:hypothetical protein